VDSGHYDLEIAVATCQLDLHLPWLSIYGKWVDLHWNNAYSS
jgi:hypothetical protein